MGGGARNQYLLFSFFFSTGRRSARECSFPESLLSSGRCQDWSAAYCMRNLERMANLDDTGGGSAGEEE